MKRQTFPIEILTPCFCAGADQSKAEIRPASIRGQLRWWFRLIDHSPEHEAMIFGSVAGEEDGGASSVAVRVSDYRPSAGWKVPEVNQSTPENYVWHFASVSGTTVKGAKGPRWTSKGAVPPHSTFNLQLIWRRSLPPDVASSFDLALRAFLAFGTIGLRATRGLGAFHCPALPGDQMLEDALTNVGFVFRRRDNPEGFTSYDSALKDYASWLRYDFRKRFKAATPSPLGSSSPRQASAIRFRCYKRADGRLGWLAYEAPHSRILGVASRHSEPILRNMKFEGHPPASQSGKSRY
jgi:CRISPR type III-B/RAMP module RAMP protein Cmr1